MDCKHTLTLTTAESPACSRLCWRWGGSSFIHTIAATWWCTQQWESPCKTTHALLRCRSLLGCAPCCHSRFWCKLLVVPGQKLLSPVWLWLCSHFCGKSFSVRNLHAYFVPLFRISSYCPIWLIILSITLLDLEQMPSRRFQVFHSPAFLKLSCLC